MKGSDPLDDTDPDRFVRRNADVPSAVLRREVARLQAGCEGGSSTGPEDAAAAVELAERYQRREHGAPPLFRWLAIMLALAALALGVLAAIKGDVALTTAMVLILLTNVAHLALNPAARPQKVARSLEASRQVSAAAGR